MGQELVKYSVATDLVETSDHELVARAPTVNQQRLREMLQGDVSLDASRCYHPPKMSNEHAEWESESAYPITVGHQSTRQLAAVRTADPKACFTGFAFGIVCAGAIGVASFLSFATVVTPQPSVAALVPVQLESQPILSASELQPQRRVSRSDHQSAWQRLSRFHTSAGKFSQPGIRLVSSLEIDTKQGGHERAQLPGTHKEAQLGFQPKTGIALASSETEGGRANQSNPTVEVHLINVASEQVAPPVAGKPAETSRREPILLEKHTDRSASTNSDQDGSDLAVEVGSGTVYQPAKNTDTQPVTQASLVPVSKSIKVIKSSLTPTARTKVRLPDRRYSTSVSRSRRLRKVTKKKADVLKPSVFGIQARPEWAKAAFNSSNN